MEKQIRFARISVKAFTEIALRLEHDEDTTQLTFNNAVIGFKNDEGAFIEPEAYKQIIAV